MEIPGSLEGAGGLVTTPPASLRWALLAQPDAYPEDPRAARVEWVETHLSHVFLTAARAYKFRKPVDLGFVDFTTRDERNADCLREVALNRRLAPDVYLGVAPLVGTPEQPRVGACAESLSAEAVEHCVVMRRLAAGRDAAALLARGELGAAEVDALAARIAAFHGAQGLGKPAPFAPAEWLAHCTRPAIENFAALAEAPEEIAPRALLAAARDRAASFAALHADRFERRRRDGRAVDGHGDLRLEHVWFEAAGAAPIVIDCVEFSAPLRRIDAASEIAFAAMDLRYRGSPLAERLLRTYARESDDFDLYSVVDWFVAYRAAVRAKVAAIAARDPSMSLEQRSRAGESARRHLDLAARASGAPGTPALVVVSGVVGTGKSTVAAALADRLDAVVVASDRVRKRLFSVAPTERLANEWGSGAYAPEHVERTYAGVLERARPVLASGRTAIVDATFSKRAQRDAAGRLAGDLGCPAFVVEVQCAPEIARDRLARRAAAATDPSDAGPEAWAPSARAFEPPDEWPAARRFRVATDRSDEAAAIAELAARIRGG
jgi:aminoglycoside phosphotransferase family enzyme/predicted kinase